MTAAAGYYTRSMTCLDLRKLAVAFVGSIPTTEMQVTSIRLERDLKEQLKQMAGNHGYQALIREVLWNYVRLRNGDTNSQLIAADIRTVVPARSTQTQRCAVTGKTIPNQSECLLGVTMNGDVVTLSTDSLAPAEAPVTAG